MKKFLFPAIILSLLIAGSCSSSNAKPAQPTDSYVPTGAAMEFVASMKIGWNLGNSLEAHNGGNPRETAWGNPTVTRELLQAVARHGFGAVRIPVSWIENIDPAPEYEIWDRWMNRVAEVVEYARAAGLKAIINIHHDGADSHYWLSVKNSDIRGAKKTEIDNQFIAVWTQIAEKFKDHGDFLIFESFNELHDGSWGDGNAAQRSRVNELNQIFVDTVRATGGRNSDRYLMINGWVTRPSVTVSSLVMPKDTVPEKLIVSIHYYDPYNFSGSANQTVWGSKANAPGGANEAHVQRTFNAVRNRFTDNGIPVILGEYGAVNQRTEAGKAYRRYYMEYITKYAIDCKIMPFYWDNGGVGEGPEKFGLINRLPPYDLVQDAAPILEAMMRAAKTDYSISEIAVP